MIGTIAKLWGAAALVAGASLFAETAAEQPPVPSSETGQENAGGKMAGNLLSGTLMPQIPSASRAAWKKDSPGRNIMTNSGHGENWAK